MTLHGSSLCDFDNSSPLPLSLLKPFLFVMQFSGAKDIILFFPHVKQFCYHVTYPESHLLPYTSHDIFMSKLSFPATILRSTDYSWHFQRKNPRPTDLKQSAQDHVASKWENWNSKLDRDVKISIGLSVVLICSAFLCVFHSGFIFERHLNIPQSFEKILPSPRCKMSFN